MPSDDAENSGSAGLSVDVEELFGRLRSDRLRAQVEARRGWAAKR